MINPCFIGSSYCMSIIDEITLNMYFIDKYNPLEFIQENRFHRKIYIYDDNDFKQAMSEIKRTSPEFGSMSIPDVLHHIAIKNSSKRMQGII